MRNLVLEIIVVEIFLLEVSPLKRKVNIVIINQGALSGVIMVLF